MNKKIVITEYENKIIIVFISDDCAIKIVALNSISDMTNTIYLGRVQKVKENINSCFVKYNNSVGFLKSKNIKPESVLPIMLKKETAKGKEDEVTDKIAISGLYSVVSDNFKGINYSSRLSSENIQKLSCADLKNVIIRNNAKNVDPESVLNEYIFLNDILSNINNIKDKRTDNSILYAGIPKIIDIIVSEDLLEYSNIITDLKDVYNLIDSFINKYKEKSIDIPINVELYNDNLVPIAAVYSLSSKIDKAINRKVYLKSDAFITFDYTEAMNVIDVNSGTTVHKGDKAEVIHKINVEAAHEIVTQLKLRNLSGIIIVDFINEYKKEYNNELIDILKRLLKEDDCHAICHGMTKLGLVEITRNRKYKPLKEQLWK